MRNQIARHPERAAKSTRHCSTNAIDEMTAPRSILSERPHNCLNRSGRRNALPFPDRVECHNRRDEQNPLHSNDLQLMTPPVAIVSLRAGPFITVMMIRQNMPMN
jgi:hypothetical protein